MLTLTDDAATAVKSIVERSADATTAGLRIHGTADPAEGFALTVAGAPEAADAVVDQEGARVFLDAGAAEALEDQVLDAQYDQEGAVHFALAAQN